MAYCAHCEEPTGGTDACQRCVAVEQEMLHHAYTLASIRSADAPCSGCGTRHEPSRCPHLLDISRCPACEAITHLGECEDCLIHASHEAEPARTANGVRRRKYEVDRCGNGHELTLDNTTMRAIKDGKQQRLCLTCLAAQQERRRERMESLTHCRNGHPIEDGAAYIAKNGKRVRRCLPCARSAWLARTNRKKEKT